MQDRDWNGLDESERYRFDNQGYLVIEDVLGESELDALNRLIDRQDLPAPSAETGNARRFGDFLSWGEPFRDLLDHDRIAPVLGELLGDGFRLDTTTASTWRRARSRWGSTAAGPPTTHRSTSTTGETTSTADSRWSPGT